MKSETQRSGNTHVLLGLLGGFALTFGGLMVGFTMDRFFLVNSVAPHGPINPWILAVPIFGIPLVLNVSIGWMLMREKPRAGRALAYGGATLSILLPLFLSTLA